MSSRQSGKWSNQRPGRARFGLWSSFLLFSSISNHLLADGKGSLEGKWATQYAEAEWVSRVRIESIASLINPSMSRNRHLAVQAYRYRASVVEQWKGGQSGTIRFEVELSNCSARLQVDREYIVFGTTDHRGGLEGHRCDVLISVEEAGPLPDILGQHSRKQGADAASGKPSNS